VKQINVRKAGKMVRAAQARGGPAEVVRATGRKISRMVRANELARVEAAPAGNPLEQYFRSNQGRLMYKWAHYFDIYHRHFARFRGTPCVVVEIGVYHGGSLQMWRSYFGERAAIYGVDVDPACKTLEEPGTTILIGDQADRFFLARLADEIGPIDILIDDGGHRMHEQITTFEFLYSRLKPEGVYLIEDLHTSYWSEYGGAYGRPGTFIEYAKGWIDQLNAWHSRDDRLAVTEFTRTTRSMHVYDSVIVLERGRVSAPVDVRSGHPVR
jgi:hypothetical protein